MRRSFINAYRKCLHRKMRKIKMTPKFFDELEKRQVYFPELKEDTDDFFIGEEILFCCNSTKGKYVGLEAIVKITRMIETSVYPENITSLILEFELLGYGYKVSRLKNGKMCDMRSGNR